MKEAVIIFLSIILVCFTMYSVGKKDASDLLQPKIDSLSAIVDSLEDEMYVSYSMEYRYSEVDSSFMVRTDSVHSGWVRLIFEGK
jgi:hypothetical protein